MLIGSFWRGHFFHSVFCYDIQKQNTHTYHLYCMALWWYWFHCVPAGKSGALALGHSPLCLSLGLLMLLIVLPCPALLRPGTWPHSPLLDQETTPHPHNQYSQLSMQYLVEISRISGFLLCNDNVICFVHLSLIFTYQHSALKEPKYGLIRTKHSTY